MSNRPFYTTMKFTDVFEDYDTFKEVYEALPAGMQVMKKVTTEGVDSYPSLETLYYLLYARYGNNPITNMDKNQWEYKLFTIVFMYGPTWEKRLDIQTSIRALDMDAIKKGTQAIYNTAMNPGDAPSTGDLEELGFINQQNTTNYKKSDLDAYAQLWDMLETDVTKELLDKFTNLFLKFVRPQFPTLYEGDEDDEY